VKVNEKEFNLCLEKDSNVAYIIDNTSGSCLEGTIKDLKTLVNSKRDEDIDVLVTGIFEIMLIDNPAILIEQDPTIIHAMAESLNPNQIVLPLEEQKAKVTVKNVETSGNTQTPIRPGTKFNFEYFNIEQYEEAITSGKKVNPRREGGLKREGLSRKFSKKWQNERRVYEEAKEYEPMFKSEQSEPITPHKETSLDTAQQETKETSNEASNYQKLIEFKRAGYVGLYYLETQQGIYETPLTCEEYDEIINDESEMITCGIISSSCLLTGEELHQTLSVAEIEHLGSINHFIMKDLDGHYILLKDDRAQYNFLSSKKSDKREDTVDMAKELEFPKPKLVPKEEGPKKWSVGAGNLNGKFGDQWDGFVIAQHDDSDNAWSIAQTPINNENGFAYYMLFPKEKTANFVFDHLMEHPGMKAKLQGSKIFQLNQILDLSEKEHQCIIIHNGVNYIHTL